MDANASGFWYSRTSQKSIFPLKNLFPFRRIVSFAYIVVCEITQIFCQFFSINILFNCDSWNLYSKDRDIILFAYNTCAIANCVATKSDHKITIVSHKSSWTISNGKRRISFHTIFSFYQFNGVSILKHIQQNINFKMKKNNNKEQIYKYFDTYTNRASKMYSNGNYCKANP